jgi:hypothetical protein
MKNFVLAKRDGANAEAHLVVLHRRHRLVSYTDMVPKGYRRSIDGRVTALWRLEVNPSHAGWTRGGGRRDGRSQSPQSRSAQRLCVAGDRMGPNEDVASGF